MNPGEAAQGRNASSPKVRSLRPTALDGAFLATLLLLLWHVWVYRFLTDDAFISFRYARNLAAGHGLVFNPGFAPVEGYTNFLWVMLLAGFSAVGIPPEGVANVLSIAATVLLWGLVVLFSRRSEAGGTGCWWALAPALFLAACRSFAVWSTSGLETRLFELLVFAGTILLILERSSQPRSRRAGVLPPLLLALATLTRPEGLLIAGALFAATWAYLIQRRAFRFSDALRQAAVYGAVVGSHLVFRVAYYGQWLPNTFYAKVGGSWWEMGTSYFSLFAIEYAAWLWIPLIVAAVAGYRREKRLIEPLLFAAVILPHAAYVAYLGGDHFEYRPLDLYLPFLFVMMAEGLRYLARGGRKAGVASAAYLALVVVGMTWLPWRTHVRAPRAYQTASIDLVRAMAPVYDPVYRLPGLRALGQRYQSLLGEAFRGFVGIRQEEHRLFLGTMIDQGKLLRGYVSDGRLPADTRIAVNSVGALPYISDLTVMDRHGLTDAKVARLPSLQKERRMAHEKFGTIDLAREEGVDFYAHGHVELVMNAADPNFPNHVAEARVGTYAARMGEGNYLMAQLPLGEPATRRKFPRLELVPLWTPSVQQQIVTEAVERLTAAAERAPADDKLLYTLAHLLYLSRRPLEAAPLFERGLRSAPDNYRLWEGLANVYRSTGFAERAREALGQAVAAARRSGDTVNADRLLKPLQPG